MIALNRLKPFGLVVLFAGLIGLSACSTGGTVASQSDEGMPPVSVAPQIDAPDPDPREGLGAGLFDAEEALWNLNKLSSTPPPDAFLGVTNSDLAFKGNYAIQGNYNGILVWDISNPQDPELVTDYLCPASQSDVSVYGDLMFVSGEGLGGRIDCGTQGVPEAVSEDRLRGIRIFEISDIRNPQYISNVQTCRGSHTHSVLVDPDDAENVYIYVSGSARVRPEDELPGCVGASPEEDPNTALFRIEVIKVPLANPAAAEIVSSPRIFDNLAPAPEHGRSDGDREHVERAKAAGKIIVEIEGEETVLDDRYLAPMMQAFMARRGGGDPTAADTAAFRQVAQPMIDAFMAQRGGGEETGPDQCHDITLFPHYDIAGGACEGYGLLLDISDPVNPVRMDAVADSNFSYWHSATFTNDATKVLFTDEWGGGGGAKCRANDPYEWGANAIFTIEEGGEMEFQTYYKMPAVQSFDENCVAHNGSLIPIPGRDVMVQSWYQGGISIFDWTDPMNPVEIAFQDYGPSEVGTIGNSGSWSVYWYNGLIVSSEIGRGLDIFELVPSPAMSANEIAAAKTVRFDYLNAQGQPYYEFPDTFVLAHAYLDQMERSGAMSGREANSIRDDLMEAEESDGSSRRDELVELSQALLPMVRTARDPARVQMLLDTVQGLAGM